MLFESWKNYLDECGKDVSRSSWTKENITRVRGECISDQNKKFSSELKHLNAGSGKELTKVIFGEVLGNYCDTTNAPDKIKELIVKLKTS